MIQSNCGTEGLEFSHSEPLGKIPIGTLNISDKIKT
jgi:hypothetical protein